MPLRDISAAYRRAAAELVGNAGQQAAYASRGHCVVLAGPGSGKTKTLVLKLARVLAEAALEFLARRQPPRRGLHHL